MLADELPYCPVFRCANRLAKSEVKKVGERAPHMQKICTDLLKMMPEDAPEEPPVRTHSYFQIFVSVYS